LEAEVTPLAADTRSAAVGIRLVVVGIPLAAEAIRLEAAVTPAEVIPTADTRAAEATIAKP
jgi:hypothetical protein